MTWDKEAALVYTHQLFVRQFKTTRCIRYLLGLFNDVSVSLLVCCSVFSLTATFSWCCFATRLSCFYCCTFTIGVCEYNVETNKLTYRILSQCAFLCGCRLRLRGLPLRIKPSLHPTQLTQRKAIAYSFGTNDVGDASKVRKHVHNGRNGQTQG